LLNWSNILPIDFIKSFSNYSFIETPKAAEAPASDNEKNFYELEKEALKLTLIDGAAHAAIALTTLPYVSGKNQFAFAGKIEEFFALSAISRQCCVGLEMLEWVEEFKEDYPDNKLIKSILPLVPLQFSFMHISSLIHEYGHYFAKRCFDLFDKDLIPTIELYPGGGSTRLKKACSSVTEDLIFTAAGPLVENIFATSLIAAAHFQSNDSLRLFLNISAFGIIAKSLKYAHSAFQNMQNSSHDFPHLWKEAGIHPYVSMACIVALPVLTKLGLILNDKLKSKDKEAIASKD
jgi:hypothetical protein